MKSHIKKYTEFINEQMKMPIETYTCKITYADSFYKEKKDFSILIDKFDNIIEGLFCSPKDKLTITYYNYALNFNVDLKEFNTLPKLIEFLKSKKVEIKKINKELSSDYIINSRMYELNKQDIKKYIGIRFGWGRHSIIFDNDYIHIKNTYDEFFIQYGSFYNLMLELRKIKLITNENNFFDFVETMDKYLNRKKLS